MSEAYHQVKRHLAQARASIQSAAYPDPSVLEMIDAAEGAANDLRLGNKSLGEQVQGLMGEVDKLVDKLKASERERKRLTEEKAASERDRLEAIARADKLAGKLAGLEAERLLWFGTAEDFSADLASAQAKMAEMEHRQRAFEADWLEALNRIAQENAARRALRRTEGTRHRPEQPG